MTQTNGETKLQKFHSVMQKVLKYGIVLALIAFIVLVLMNKDQFSEKVAKGTPEHKLTKIEVTDGDKVVQKFKAVSRLLCTIYFHYAKYDASLLSYLSVRQPLTVLE